MKTYSGNGVGIAFLDTGIYRHVDFDGRIRGFYDVVNRRISAYDDNSHGSHVCGIAAGNGKASNGRYVGSAPEANLIGVKILNRMGKGNLNDALIGLEWIRNNYRKYNIRIVNLSFASDKIEDKGDSPLNYAVEELWDKGIVVVTAAGNNGPADCTIGNPGNCRRIITVGAYDELYSVDSRGQRKVYYSGRGCTDQPFIKPEIVARGSQIVSCTNSRRGYVPMSGSSMAAPFIAGLIACLLQKYPDMTPVDVKLRLHDRAINLGLPQNVQGWGTIDRSFLD